MKFYATCQYKCGDNKQINCNYNCRLGHANMATGSGDYPDHTTTNPTSPSSLYSICPQYRSLPRNLYSALRQQESEHQQQQHQQQQSQQHHNCEYNLPKTNSEQELRRSALNKSPTSKCSNLILCSKCAV